MRMSEWKSSLPIISFFSHSYSSFFKSLMSQFARFSCCFCRKTLSSALALLLPCSCIDDSHSYTSRSIWHTHIYEYVRAPRMCTGTNVSDWRRRRRRFSLPVNPWRAGRINYSRLSLDDPATVSVQWINLFEIWVSSDLFSRKWADAYASEKQQQKLVKE